MDGEDCTIIQVRSVDGGYQCVAGEERLLANLSMGKRVMAEDVDTGERMKIVLSKGQVLLMPIANPEIAETIAAKAIAKAYRSSTLALKQLARAAKKSKRS